MSELYGPAVATATRTLQAEPKLRNICCLMQGGILAHPWTQVPAVHDYLATVRPHRRAAEAWKLLHRASDYMKSAREDIARSYDRAMRSATFAALPIAVQDQYAAVAHLARRNGPNVLASHRVLTEVIHKLTGRRYSIRQMGFGWRKLRSAGFLQVTEGQRYEPGKLARATVYHLLTGHFTSHGPGTELTCEVGEPGPATGPSPDAVALAWRYFEEAIEQVRRMKWLRRNGDSPLRERG